MNSLRFLLLSFLLLFLSSNLILSAADSEGPVLVRVGDSSVKTQTISRPLFTQGIESQNAEGYKVSDGSDPRAILSGLNTSLERHEYKQVKLKPEIIKINQEGAEFSKKERERKRDFFQSIEGKNFSDEELEAKLLEFRQKSLERQQKFKLKQERRLAKIICEDSKTLPCEEIKKETIIEELLDI